MEQEIISKVEKLEKPKMVLQNLRVGGSIIIPSSQKNSIASTIIRIKDETPNRAYSVTKIDKYSYSVKRSKDEK